METGVPAIEVGSEVWEQLVKLASFGTAGVCVLIVFIVGVCIMRLPSDTSALKVSLIKWYMTVCTIIAFISAGSGIANAYFNREKLVVANRQIGIANQQIEEAETQAETARIEQQATLEVLERNRAEIDDTKLALSRIISDLEPVSAIPRTKIDELKSAQVRLQEISGRRVEAIEEGVQKRRPETRINEGANKAVPVPGRDSRLQPGG